MNAREASLEQLIETEDLGIEVLHPGGLDITRELAGLCEIRQGTSVLDVASGTGESACFLAERFGAHVIGIDLSDDLLERARAKAARQGLAVEFRKGDAHALDFGESTFDAVISECTLCLLDKKRAVREMIRVAKPGGRVGIHDVCWREGAPAELKKRLADLEGEEPETLDGWKSLLLQAGLVDVRAVDKSAVIPGWTKDVERAIGLTGRLKLLLKVTRRWGFSGLRNVLESERIFRSAYTGYGIIVGTKPEPRPPGT